MEDARIKLDKDPSFPPSGGLDQFVYSYSENLLDTSGNLVGFYEVQINSTHRVYPFGVLKIRSIGRVGQRDDRLVIRMGHRVAQAYVGHVGELREVRPEVAE